MLDVQRRFETLRAVRPQLNLFALVDGYQYELHTGERLQREAATRRALFDRTEDEPLAHAGPWLLDVTSAADSLEPLLALEQARPAVSWLITAIDLEGLSQLLQLKLEAALPEGRRALLRFYDPRVLGNLFHTMSIEQRAQFFHLIDEWHFLYKGRRVWAGHHGA